MKRMRLGTMPSRLAVVLLLLGVTAPVLGIAAQSLARTAPHRAGPIVRPLVRYAVSPPLRTLAKAPTNGRQIIPLRRRAALPAGKPSGLRANAQPQVAPLLPALSNTFSGIGNGFSGPQGTFTLTYVPPDTDGAVGPQDYVQIVNTSFAVFNKDPTRGAVGTVRYGPVATNTLFSGVGGLCEKDNDGDAIVVYDQMADRWIISQFALQGATTINPTTYYQCIAVSTSSDPTGSYYRYVAGYPMFIDYPKMAVWPDAYYESYNLFDSTGNTSLGAEVCAFNRARMLTGAPASQVCFQFGTSDFSLLPSTLDGSRLPPSGSPDYLLELGTTTSLTLRKFHVDFATPGNSTITNPSSIAVAAYAPALCGGGSTICVPQPSTTQQLDTLGDRLMYRLAYRNFGGYESLVVDHAITSGSSMGVRWYEIRDPNGTPSVTQQGTYAPDASYRWMGSIAQDHVGDMALGFSLASGTIHPSVGITGRLAGDPAGTLPQGETIVTTGAGSQTGNLGRWGDYSSMAVDPTDDCTFWYTNEYIPSNGIWNWKTTITSFSFPSCVGMQLIQNGGFESGAASWTQYSYAQRQTIYASAQAHAGTQAFFPCGYPTCDDRVSQSVTVPAKVNSATLRFWLSSFSSLAALPGAPCADRFSATLATPDGTVISNGTLAPLCETVAAGGYTLETFDVTSLLQAHAGQQLIVTLRGTTTNLTGDAGTFTHWGVDDVSLTVS